MIMQKVEIEKDTEKDGYNQIVTVALDPKRCLEKIEELLRGFRLSQEDKNWSIPILTVYDSDNKNVLFIRCEQKGTT